MHAQTTEGPIKAFRMALNMAMEIQYQLTSPGHSQRQYWIRVLGGECANPHELPVAHKSTKALGVSRDPYIASTKEAIMQRVRIARRVPQEGSNVCLVSQARVSTISQADVVSLSEAALAGRGLGARGDRQGRPNDKGDQLCCARTRANNLLGQIKSHRGVEKRGTKLLGCIFMPAQMRANGMGSDPMPVHRQMGISKGHMDQVLPWDIVRALEPTTCVLNSIANLLFVRCHVFGQDLDGARDDPRVLLGADGLPLPSQKLPGGQLFELLEPDAPTKWSLWEHLIWSSSPRLPISQSEQARNTDAIHRACGLNPSKVEHAGRATAAANLRDKG